MKDNIARMNERIIIEKNSVTVDKAGNHRNTWEEYYSCYANAAATLFKEGEEEQAGQIVSDQSLTFTVRWCSEVARLTTTNFRIRFHDLIYNIVSIDSMNFQHKQMKLRCTRERRET